jgi:hypothetical protein
MGKMREMSDKVSEFTDKYGIANPIEVADEALGGQTREESKARREKIKLDKEKPAPDLTLEERKAITGKAAAEAYDRDRSNWPLSPKKRARITIDAQDTVTKKNGGAIKSSASKRADGCAIRGKTRA